MAFGLGPLYVPSIGLEAHVEHVLLHENGHSAELPFQLNETAKSLLSSDVCQNMLKRLQEGFADSAADSKRTRAPRLIYLHDPQLHVLRNALGDVKEADLEAQSAAVLDTAVSKLRDLHAALRALYRSDREQSRLATEAIVALSASGSIGCTEGANDASDPVVRSDSRSSWSGGPALK